ncbi:hypothetical protein [Mesorhizobium sp. Root102]|uniref:hypothetical protein n=1 Tax=Mesorhizobium sp. Root102 TaxID=1736422 RepID=UPI0012E3AE1F|nr:hypothetical protein [Mesorhizobium sp. Root102]
MERAGFTAEQAADAAFAVEGWDMNGAPEDALDDWDCVASDAWEQANIAALEACCAGWPDDRRPTTVSLELLIEPETQLADRPKALAMLRERAEDDKQREFDGSDGILAWRVAADLENKPEMRDLVTGITVAFTALKLAHFYPDEQIEPKRQAVHDAINALEAATEKPTSH